MTELYFEKEGVKLLHGDCLDLLPRIKPESVTTIFADPPYNIRKAEWDKFESQEKYIS